MAHRKCSLADPVTLLAVGCRSVPGGARPRLSELLSSSAVASDGDPLVHEGEALLGFPTAATALATATAVHRAVAEEDWPAGIQVRVGIGVHTVSSGRPVQAATLRHCLDVRDVARGGQTMVTAAAAAALGDTQPEDGRLVAVGRHRLRDLAGAVQLHAFDTEDRQEDDLAPASLETVSHNLRGQLTRFVGRRAELAELTRLLGEHRLLTLAGPGGAGKSRLAAHALAQLSADLHDGVWWVDLGSVADPEHVLAAVVTALNLPVDPLHESPNALAERIRDRHLVLCLDTCEHVVDACAELVAAVLQNCAAVRVMATSREPLGVPGELVWRVPPLPPDQGGELFRDRASLVRGGGAGLDSEAVAELSRRLDGMPLAIELAAVWAATLSPAQIASGLEDHLDLLGSGSQLAVPRQQTLAASMQWSHDLLDEPDRLVFRRLAVFQGEFGLEAAQAICTDDLVLSGEVLTRIGRLVDRSLVVARPAGSHVRYRLLDTIRQYAEVQLAASDETDTLRARHLDHFLGVAQDVADAFELDQDTQRQRLAAERDNLRAALRHGLDQPDPERGRRLAAALAPWWFVTGQAHEGIGVLRRAIDRAPEERSLVAARLLTGIAMLGMVSGRFAMSEQASTEAAELAAEVGDEISRGRALVMEAYRWFLFDIDRCRELAREAHLVGEAAGDAFARDWGMVQEAYTYVVQDRFDEAMALAERAYRLSRSRGDRFTAGFARSVELWEAYAVGDLVRARSAGREAAELVAPLGDFFASGTIVVQEAMMLGLMGDLAGARALCDPVVRVFESAPDVDIVGFMVALGGLYLWAGKLAEAEAWLSRGSRFAAPAVDNWTATRSLPGLAKALRLLGRADEARAAATRGIELARSFDGASIWAQALDELALLTAADDPTGAEALHHEALALRVDRGARVHQVDSLDALAALSSEAGAHGEAARLLAASDAARAAMGYPRPPVDAPAHERLVETLRAELGEELDQQWSAGASWSLDEAVSFVRRARGSRDRPPTGWASLTPTELEVVRLVARGLTNPEVGDRLFVSLSTVKTHLTHVFGKLGVTNRTELTRLALRHDP